MSTLVLTTKLFVPPPPPKAVSRPRLIERLDGGLHRKLSLIAAPAGFGKTTLVSEWIAAADLPAAWLSLEEADGDPARFLTYLVAALQTIAPHLGSEVLAALHPAQPPLAEAMLTGLLNEITLLPHKCVLVLDDYHVIDSPAIDHALTFLIEHLPPALHLVITTREDPPLPLARWRARGLLAELRGADLRFTTAEAAAFLREVMGLVLAADQIAALEARTEGWIAGLQLAALSIQGQAEPSRFIQSFTGSHRFVLDYLVEEVLQQQPASVQAFLLQTSILDRLCGSLCDAVTGQAAGSAQLEALARGNFFVVPLDDQRQWYRYHYLFADVLSTHLLAEQPDQLPTLHRRAGRWYADNGLPAPAIGHALAGGDFDAAADLMELAMVGLRRSRQEATMLGWLKALPDALVRRRPLLSVHYAGILLVGGELEGAEARLRDAERWLPAVAGEGEQPQAPSSEMPAARQEALRGLESSIAMYRAAIALVSGHVAGTLQYAGRALELAPAQDHIGRGAAAGFLGLGHWSRGELATAQRWYTECMAAMVQAAHIPDALGCAMALADIRLAQGRMHAALHTYEQALQLAAEQGAPAVRGLADMHVGISGVYLERNDLAAAAQHLLRSKDLGELAGAPQNPYRWCAAMARIRAAEGDLDGALNLLREAERLYVSDFFPNERPIAAAKARVWVRQGRLGEALAWVRERGLSAADDLSYLREFEHITLVRVLLARHQGDRAGGDLIEGMSLLDRLLQAAEAEGRVRSILEILLLQALAHQAQGDILAAFPPLRRALALAEPEGYVRLFVDEGLPLAHLLREAGAHETLPAYAGVLLAALGVEQADNVSPPALRPAPTAPPLVEPLSRRELEVLRLFRSEMSGPEIADTLMVALSTVRSHTKHIYSKLDVNSRQAAVRRATELGLI